MIKNQGLTPLFSEKYHENIINGRIKKIKDDIEKQEKELEKISKDKDLRDKQDKDPDKSTGDEEKNETP